MVVYYSLQDFGKVENGRWDEKRETQDFFILGRGTAWESFQEDEKVEEFKKELKRSRMTEKVMSKLSMIR